MLNDLRDPESAQFSDLRVVRVVGDRGSSVTSVCGLYNSKNGYGGYGGFAPFYYVREVIDTRGIDGPYMHHLQHELTMVDSGDDPLIQQMHQTAYDNLCGTTTNLSEDDVLLAPASLWQKRKDKDREAEQQLPAWARPGGDLSQWQGASSSVNEDQDAAAVANSGSDPSQ